MENIKQIQTLQGNPARFTQAKSESRCYAERPMTLSAWTQTTDNDFGLNKNNVFELPKVSDHGVNTIKVVCDNVRILQDSLRQHVDFLTELCSNNSNENLQPPMMQYQNERATVSEERKYSPSQQQQHILTPPDSVFHMDIVEEIPTASEERINYNVTATDNTSAESCRLEICVEDEQIPRPEVFASPMQHVACTVNVVTEKIPSSLRNSQATRGSITQNSNILTVSNANDINIGTTNSNTPKQKNYFNNNMVSLGPNNTCIRAHIYASINWNSYSNATRKLLLEIFGKEMLATHSLSGKPSPAFKNQNRPTKRMLDQLKVQDIIFTVKSKCGVSVKEIRNAITTKCADSNKTCRKQMISNSLQNISIDDKENT